jgi:acyl carrier protein
MSTTPWPAGFDTALRTHLPLLEPDQPITEDLDLAASGLDSLATVSLLLELEDSFGVMIPDEAVTGTTFRTVGSLWLVMAALVESN